MKTVATRRRILKLKCTKFDFYFGSVPDPAGDYSAPQALQLDLRGLPLREREGRDGKEGRGREKGSGRGERKGEEDCLLLGFWGWTFLAVWSPVVLCKSTDTARFLRECRPCLLRVSFAIRTFIMLSFAGQASLRENTLAYAAIQTISRSIGYCMLQRSRATPLNKSTQSNRQTVLFTFTVTSYNNNKNYLSTQRIIYFNFDLLLQSVDLFNGVARDRCSMQ